MIAIREGRGCLSKIVTAVLALLCLGAVLAAWWVYDLNRHGRMLHQQALKEASDLQARRSPVRSSENAADPFAVACGQYVAPADPGLERREKDPVRDFSSAAVTGYLRKNQRCLDSLEKALLLPACDYGTDFSQGIRGTRSGLAKDNRNMVRLLVVAARCRALEGKTDQATDRLGLVLRVADPVNSQPVLKTRMVRCAVERRLPPAMAGVFNSCEPKKDELASMVVKLREHLKVRGGLAPCFEQERVLLKVSAGLVASGQLPVEDIFMGGSRASYLDLRRWRYSGNILEDARMLDGRLRECEGILKKPYPQLLRAATELEAKFRETHDWALLTAAAMPKLSFSAQTDAEALAAVQLCLLAVGARLHRMASGSYPPKIDDLAATLGSLPSDPFSGKPFRYRRTARGCVIWSIARNCRDEGGDPRQDVVLELKK
jgi:hypothetical protein